MNEGLTGKRRFRRGWFGSLILQVQVRTLDIDNFGGGEHSTFWRDARIEDLTAEEPHDDK
jgi:hypothetical protein